jgi:hypothetical protein
VIFAAMTGLADKNEALSRRAPRRHVVTGMSFFVYCDCITANAVLPLKIQGSSDHIGICLTQKEPVFGAEYDWSLR